MTKYKEVEDTTGVGYEVCRDKFGSTLYYKDGKLHRLDGPAVCTWHKFKQGCTRMYYVEGTMLDADKFLYLVNCPLKVLPLYLTIPHYSEIVRYRLAGSKTEIDIKNNQLLTKILKHLKCPVTSAGSNPFRF